MDIVERIIGTAFVNGETDLHKTLWRMTNGDYMYSYHLIRNMCLRHGFDITTDDFDAACGELNDGFDVEWNTYDEAPPSRSYTKLKEENESYALS